MNDHISKWVHIVGNGNETSFRSTSDEFADEIEEIDNASSTMSAEIQNTWFRSRNINRQSGWKSKRAVLPNLNNCQVKKRLEFDQSNESSTLAYQLESSSKNSSNPTFGTLSISQSSSCDHKLDTVKQNKIEMTSTAINALMDQQDAQFSDKENSEMTSTAINELMDQQDAQFSDSKETSDSDKTNISNEPHDREQSSSCDKLSNSDLHSSNSNNNANSSDICTLEYTEISQENNKSGSLYEPDTCLSDTQDSSGICDPVVTRRGGNKRSAKEMDRLDQEKENELKRRKQGQQQQKNDHSSKNFNIDMRPEEKEKTPNTSKNSSKLEFSSSISNISGNHAAESTGISNSSSKNSLPSLEVVSGHFENDTVPQNCLPSLEAVSGHFENNTAEIFSEVELEQHQIINMKNKVSSAKMAVASAHKEIAEMSRVIAEKEDIITSLYKAVKKHNSKHPNAKLIWNQIVTDKWYSADMLINKSATELRAADKNKRAA